MRAITKRELNQHTAEVLDVVSGGSDVIITERGEPRWRISPYRAQDSGLRRLERLGQYTPPSITPTPWAERPGRPAYTDTDVEAVLREMKGAH